MPSDNRQKTSPLHVVPNADDSSPASPIDREPTARNESKVCKLCFGTGLEVVPGKGARRCECRKQNSKEKLLEAARIPRRYVGCTLQSYRADSYAPEYSSGTQSWALMKAKELAANYHTSYKEQGRGLLFMGPVGIGKTHLAVGILHSLMEQGVECLFYEFGSLLKRIQDSYNPISQSSELGVLSPVYEAEVLVLDELGSTIPTNWVRDTIAQIINRRYNDRKVTIFTTNYLDDLRHNTETRDPRPIPILEKLQSEIVNLRTSIPRNEAEQKQRELRLNEKLKYEKQILSEIEMTPDQRIQKLTKLEDRIGVSMRSRLYEMCETVVIKGTDYRRRPRRQEV